MLETDVNKCVIILNAHSTCHKCNAVIPIQSPIYPLDKKVLNCNTICRCNSVYQIKIKNYENEIIYKYSELNNRKLKNNFNEKGNISILCKCLTLINFNIPTMQHFEEHKKCACGRCYVFKIAYVPEAEIKKIIKVDVSGNPLPMKDLVKLYIDETKERRERFLREKDFHNKKVY